MPGWGDSTLLTWTLTYAPLNSFRSSSFITTSPVVHYERCQSMSVFKNWYSPKPCLNEVNSDSAIAVQLWSRKCLGHRSRWWRLIMGTLPCCWSASLLPVPLDFAETPHLQLRAAWANLFVVSVCTRELGWQPLSLRRNTFQMVCPS